MMKFKKGLGESYSPLYFLAALGAGGTAITFFMYLVFMTPHKGVPISTFDTLSVFVSNSPIWVAIPVALSAIGIAVFSVIHVYLLIWNIKEYRTFKQTEGYKNLCETNAEIQIMAIPLTFGMTVNVLFIVGAIFIPNLWSVVEYLFPLALLAFGVVGYYAVRIFSVYSTRVLSTGAFNTAKNNNLSQMLGVFAFTMVGVGFSASAAMSHNTTTSGVAIIFAILFTTIAAIFAIIKITTGFQAMLEHGADKETSVSLWIMIPIMTLIGITVYRLSMAMHHNFGTDIDAVSHMAWFVFVASIQALFGLLGYTVMKKMGYFKSFLSGEDKSAASYALVCPGVAAVVMGFFLLHKGLVAPELVSQFSVVYFLLLTPLVLLQLKTIKVLFKLNGKMLRQAV